MPGVVSMSALRAAILELVKSAGNGEAWRDAWNEAIDAAIKIVDEHEALAVSSSDAGRADLRRHGKHLGGDIPYGRQLADDGATLISDVTELEIIRIARELRADGSSFAAIGRELADRAFLARNGRMFAPAQIRRMMENDGVITPAPSPPIPAQSRTRARRKDRG